MPDAMQHLAKEILVTAAIVVFGYIAFVAGVIGLAHVIVWFHEKTTKDKPQKLW
jgi:hypothetical protein